MIPVIVDGDWGGDEMQLLAVLLASKKYRVIGATAVFGNTDHDQVLGNAGRILLFLGAGDIPYFPGAKGPTGAEMLEGDGAHGSDGIGGVELPPALTPPQATHAVDFILETLCSNPPGSVVITATGPLSNIAQAFAKDPEAMRRVRQIVIMGGCTAVLSAADMPTRQGNITPFAEFNFYMAANDAGAVMGSGLPITLLPMNCTQQMDVTPERQAAIRQALGDKADRVIGMMCAPAELDRKKFNAAPFMHDVHTALYLEYPDAYAGQRGTVSVVTSGDRLGHASLMADPAASTTIMDTIVDPDRMFAAFLESLRSQLLV